MNFKESFNFLGIEEIFETMLDRACSERTTVNFQYLELGIARGGTLIAVADHLQQRLSSSWRATGIDLCDSSFFEVKDFLRRSLHHDAVIEFCGSGRSEPFVNDQARNDLRVMLLKSPEKRAIVAPNSVNFCLIDACHGAPCVEKDFLSIEAGIAEGGIVAFHDASEDDQGIHFQKHCQEHIGVARAMENLGLYSFFNRHKSFRDGWNGIGFCNGDKSPGNLELNGHGIIFFQKVEAAKNPYQEGFTG